MNYKLTLCILAISLFFIIGVYELIILYNFPLVNNISYDISTYHFVLTKCVQNLVFSIMIAQFLAKTTFENIVMNFAAKICGIEYMSKSINELESLLVILGMLITVTFIFSVFNLFYINLYILHKDHIHLQYKRILFFELCISTIYIGIWIILFIIYGTMYLCLKCTKKIYINIFNLHTDYQSIPV
jgi:hypothetical protein